MNRPLRTASLGLFAVLLPSTLMAAPAQASQPVKTDPARAAHCISDHLPRGAQVFRAGDGSFRVVSFGPRGIAARWTVRQASTAVEVSQSGGPAGLSRDLKGVCY